MEGVILFADDHIHSLGEDRKERLLFEELRKDLPVLGVDSLELAASAVKSIGSFGAIILDWQFNPQEAAALLIDVEEEGKAAGLRGGVSIPSSTEDATYKFLMEHNFYSLVFILSDKDVASTHGDELSKKYGDRIKIKKKSDYFSLPADEQKQSILEEILQWKDSQKNLSVPIQWSAAINECMQSIFKDLSEADVDWIKEIYISGKDDGVSPEIFLVEILQLLLMEQLVQHDDLIESLKAEGEAEKNAQVNEDSKKKSLSKLFSRLYYSKLTETAPVMTGDIFELNADEYGIVITPECDVWKIKANENLYFDLLTFSKDSMALAFQEDSVKKQKKAIFNPVLSSWHFLPALPLLSDELTTGCAIDFSTGSRKMKSAELLNLPKKYKVNSPFIQSLRQRYLSHLGRVGTPQVHDMVTKIHLEKLGIIKPEAAAPQPAKKAPPAVAERRQQPVQKQQKKFAQAPAEAVKKDSDEAKTISSQPSFWQGVLTWLRKL